MIVTILCASLLSPNPQPTPDGQQPPSTPKLGQFAPRQTLTGVQETIANTHTGTISASSHST